MATVSHCHKVKMIRHSITGAWICSQCGYYAQKLEVASVKKPNPRKLF